MEREAADLVIENALLIDGTGAPPAPGGLAVKDGSIVALGDVEKISGGRRIDAAGKALAPGFIDTHAHDDRAVLDDPLMTCKISQGVTTVIAGNCGASYFPRPRGAPPPPLNMLSQDREDFFSDFKSYAAAIENDPPSLNILCQVGHTTLRAEAMERLNRPATPEEIRRMRAGFEDALGDGAIGLSTGLFYEPANAASREEVIEIAKSLGSAGGLYTTHLRDETDGVAEALQEGFEIGAGVGAPMVVSHHKCAGAANHGRSKETLALIDRARKSQLVGLDVYPYTAGSTVLDPDRMMGASRIVVAASDPHPECCGRDLDDIAEEWGVSIREAADRLQPAAAIYYIMDEADVRRILKYPHTMIGSDGIPGGGHPHPRLWGTFPRVLGHYARDVGLFSLEEAVRKMTSLPAEQFGLRNRGRLKAGAVADLVLFDPGRVVDVATFNDPMQPALGIESVFVAGREVWREGRHTGERGGRLIRLNAAEADHLR